LIILESSIPASYPLRLIRRVADEVWDPLDTQFAASLLGERLSVDPAGTTLRGLSLKVFYTIRQFPALRDGARSC
jgi:hypothetical protein